MNELTREDFPRQDAHVGNVRHGVATGPWRIDFVAPVETVAGNGGDPSKIFQGSVVSLNSYGKFVPGCAAGSGINHPVPFISLKNVFDPDVTTGKAVILPGSTVANMARSTYSAMGGNIAAIPTTCGYELETTEFNTAATYAINDAVIPDAVTAGKVTVATAAPGKTEVCLGFVSQAPATDYFGNKRIAFFANFIPALGIA